MEQETGVLAKKVGVPEQLGLRLQIVFQAFGELGEFVGQEPQFREPFNRNRIGRAVDHPVEMVGGTKIQLD
ncbi:hypothetical protein D3C76_1479980 [compost metagenome]